MSEVGTGSGDASFEIQGRRVTLPCVVRDASSSTASWLVDARRARELLPAPELEVVELLPGRALFSLACIDYRDNDLGDYNEVSVALFVRLRSERAGIPYLGAGLDLVRGKLATYIHRLPVNQAFTCEAGRKLWGFPKTVEEIDFEPMQGSIRCRWSVEGRRVLCFEGYRKGNRSLPAQSLLTYTMREGALHRTRFVTQAEAAGFRLGGATLELGDHPIADELRRLGLEGRRPLFSVWMGRMRGRFEAAEKL